MNIIDSSIWIEYLAGSELSKQFYEIIFNIDNIIIPTVILN